MYPIPSHFSLAALLGQEVNVVLLGLYQMDVIFQAPDPRAGSGDGGLPIEGAWELTYRAELLDQSTERSPEANAARDAYRIHRLLGRRVVDWDVEGPAAFSLTFDDGYALRVFDDLDGQYEWAKLTLPGESEAWIF